MLVNYSEKNFKFADIFRLIVSGSSGVGKTHFVKQLIQAKLFKTDRVVLFHPDVYENLPVDWHETLDIDVVYRVGLPDVEYLTSLPEYTTVVIDDQFDKAISSQTIDYLVRVLSSKRKLHTILLAQHYFAKGPLGVSIRDSIIYHVCMPGNNNSIDIIARNFKLTSEIREAENFNQGKDYPYIFIARDNSARRSQVQVFVEIFSKLKIVIIGQMKYYLVEKADFDICLKKKDNNVAEYVNESTKPVCSSGRKNNGGKTKNSKFKSRQKLEAKIRRLVHRHQVRSRF